MLQEEEASGAQRQREQDGTVALQPPQRPGAGSRANQEHLLKAVK